MARSSRQRCRGSFADGSSASCRRLPFPAMPRALAAAAAFRGCCPGVASSSARAASISAARLRAIRSGSRPRSPAPSRTPAGSSASRSVVRAGRPSRALRTTAPSMWRARSANRSRRARSIRSVWPRRAAMLSRHRRGRRGLRGRVAAGARPARRIGGSCPDQRHGAVACDRVQEHGTDPAERLDRVAPGGDLILQHRLHLGRVVPGKGGKQARLVAIPIVRRFVRRLCGPRDGQHRGADLALVLQHRRGGPFDLILLQTVMLASLDAGVAPHPPTVTARVAPVARDGTGTARKPPRPGPGDDAAAFTARAVPGPGCVASTCAASARAPAISTLRLQ